PISPPQTIAAAIRHLMVHGPGSIERDRTMWERAHLLTAISRDRAAHLPDGFWPPDQEATPCP
ncbi:hypothetical protein, partial [Streptomyces sp. 8K308]|uniref:hypothetical protein n=1 Tax=Streptomyces sp. 8K308 TaxID=2530388 RepID=UPI001404A94F